MPESKFVYVTYIRTTPEKLWEALTTPEFQKQYWFGMHLEADWRGGGSWNMQFPDGRVADEGDVLECDRPRRLVLKWHHQLHPELKAEGWAHCAMDLEPEGTTTKLTITHTIDHEPSKLIEKVSGGWPMILSSLKSLLETGSALSRPN